MPEVASLTACVNAERGKLTISQPEFTTASARLVALPPERKLLAAEHVVALALRIGREANEVPWDSVLQALANVVAQLVGSQRAARDLFHKRIAAEKSTALSGDQATTPHAPVDLDALWK